jgi:hypothetical protein
MMKRGILELAMQSPKDFISALRPDQSAASSQSSHVPPEDADLFSVSE